MRQLQGFWNSKSECLKELLGKKLFTYMFRFKAHKSGTHFPIDEANGGSNFIGTFRRDHSCSTRNDKFAVEYADIFCAELRMSRFFGITIKAKKKGWLVNVN